ncbi:MAG: hypothetical protein ACO22B_11400 [Ilumatobacteraceae bacterium]
MHAKSLASLPVSGVCSRLAEIKVERARLDAEEVAFVRHLSGLTAEGGSGIRPPYS